MAEGFRKVIKCNPVLWRILGVTVAILLAVGGVWWFVSSGNFEQRIAFVQTMGGIIGGSALLFGLYFTARTLQVNREGQITERFTRAIDQLGATDDAGNKRMEIRLGAIYALERIARDSKQDHWPIMEILTAYVREHASLPDNTLSSTYFERQPEQVDQLLSSEIKEVSADIQATLAVLGRRDTDHEEEEQRLDLSRTNLRKARLQGTQFKRANFDEALLERANFDNANLKGASFWGTHLELAQFNEAHLESAHFGRAHLQRAHFWKAHLEGAYLTSANCERTAFKNAYMAGAYLLGARLKEANLKGSDLTNAEAMSQSQIEGVNEGYVSENTKLPTYLSMPAWIRKLSEQRTSNNY